MLGETSQEWQTSPREPHTHLHRPNITVWGGQSAIQIGVPIVFCGSWQIDDGIVRIKLRNWDTSAGPLMSQVEESPTYPSFDRLVVVADW